MPRFVRRNVPPIMTDKHELTWSNLGQNASTAIVIKLAEGVVPANKNVADEVVIGSHIRWVYFEFHFSAETITNPKVIHWQVRFKRADQTMPAPSLYNQNNKNQIIKRGMEILPKDVSTVFKRVFVVKIPKIYQRAVQLGRLEFAYISSSAETINACGIVVYKEIY